VVTLKVDSPIELMSIAKKATFASIIVSLILCLIIKEHPYYIKSMEKVKFLFAFKQLFIYSKISNMCFATPGKVIKIKGKIAFIEMPKHRHQVDISLLKNVKIGDYLLVHQKMAINKIPKNEAQKILKFHPVK